MAKHKISVITNEGEELFLSDDFVELEVFCTPVHGFKVVQAKLNFSFLGDLDSIVIVGSYLYELDVLVNIKPLEPIPILQGDTLTIKWNRVYQHLSI